MNWQEYQEAVTALYEQAEGLGSVSKNVYINDKITGQPRQIDTLIEIEARGHKIKVIIDAKFHSDPLDVRDIESVISLASAVGADKSVIVAANGWTQPAKIKADFSNCDLRLLSIDEALDFIVPDQWELCPSCEKDCVVLDQDGSILLNGSILWWLAGQCRACKYAFAWCQECGERMCIPINESTSCNCGYDWCNTQKGIGISFGEVIR